MSPAANQFRRTPIYGLEKPLSGDVDRGFSDMDATIRELASRMFSGANGFLLGGFQPIAAQPNSMNVVLKAGLAFFTNATDTPAAIASAQGVAQTGVDDLHPYKPIVLSQDLTVAVPTAPGAQSRIDLIEVAYARQLNNSQSRNFLNTSNSQFAPALVPKTVDPYVDNTLAYYTAAQVPTTALAYKSGVVSGSPVAPTTDTGYMAIATIVVGTNVVTILPANITDQRALIALGWLLNKQIFTGNGTYTPTLGTRRVKVRMCGGGGGGGGTGANGASQAAASGGGGAAASLEFNVTNGANLPITGGAITIGGLGAGGVGNANGTAGGDTSAVINGTTYLARGGAGGNTVSATAAPIQAAGGGQVGGSTSPPTVDVLKGDFGTIGVALQNSSSVLGGNGGSGPFGVGGAGTSVGVGGAATGFGAGGGGTAQVASGAALNGGAGAPGLVIIEEYA